MTTHPIAARLAVYLLLAAENDGKRERAPEVLEEAEAIVGRLSAAEFQLYADEYDDSRIRWEVSQVLTAMSAN